MIIAIDGPAASGKGTLGKRLAAHYGLRHLDTGLIYRAVAKAVLDAGHPLGRCACEPADAARSLDPAHSSMKRMLKSHRIGEAASVVSAIPEVRAALLDFQREFGRTPPGAVLDGRDIGTVIFPDADVKIYRHRDAGGARPPAGAGAQGRRERRSTRRTSWPTSCRRDERDTSRAAAPLKPAPDAHLLDTTHLDIDAAFRAAIDIVEAVRAGRKRG